MERRLARINSSAAGGTASAGAKTHKVTLPSRWLQAMGITDEEREVELTFDQNRIVITKVVTIEEFISEKKAQSHCVKRLKFWNSKTLCTTIAVDFTDHTLCVENHTKQLVKTAFGKNRLPTWTDLMAFLEERCIPRQREGIREYLDALGLDEYDPWEIVKRTQGRMAYVLLGDVVDFIPEKQNACGKKITVQKSSIYQYVEIQDIGFGDFHCKEMRGWELPSRAKHFSSAGDIYIGAIWGSAIKWCYIPEGIDNVVVTNGCFRCRVKAGMEKFTPDLLAYLNSEGWGVQMRAFSRGSDGLAEICEDDAKNVIIPLLSDDVRDGLSEYVENLQRGTTTINSVVKQLIKDERIAYNDPDKRPSHIVIV